MAEAKDAVSEKKGKKAGGKEGKGGGADGKKNKFDPRMVKNIARTISGLKSEEWNKLGKESQKVHLKTAKKVLLVQQKIAAKPAKLGKEGQRAESAKD